MQRRQFAVGMLVASIVVAACARESASPPRTDPTIPTLPAETTTTAAANPYAIPTVIDAAYVNRVLAGLDQAVGEITRIVVRERSITQEVGDRIRAVFTPQARQLALDLYVGDIGRGLAGYRANPGNEQTTVDELLSVNPGCVFARVRRDGSAVAVVTDPRLSTLWVAIVPSVNGPEAFNPTGWSYLYEGFQRGFVAPADPCAS